MRSEQTELLSKLSSLPDSLIAASAAITTAQTELVTKGCALTDMQDLQEVVKAMSRRKWSWVRRGPRYCNW